MASTTEPRRSPGFRPTRRALLARAVVAAPAAALPAVALAAPAAADGRLLALADLYRAQEAEAVALYGLADETGDPATGRHGGPGLRPGRRDGARDRRLPGGGLPRPARQGAPRRGVPGRRRPRRRAVRGHPRGPRAAGRGGAPCVSAVRPWPRSPRSCGGSRATACAQRGGRAGRAPGRGDPGPARPRAPHPDAAGDHVPRRAAARRGEAELMAARPKGAPDARLEDGIATVSYAKD